MTVHVFISYVRDNAETVERLAQELRGRGIDVWLDRDRIMPGQRWRDAIREAIRSGALFIACFSREYAERDKSYMNEELTLAIEELRQRSTDKTWFIPVVLPNGDVPARAIGAGETLRDLQWVDLGRAWASGIDLIARVASSHDGDSSASSSVPEAASSSDGPLLSSLQPVQAVWKFELKRPYTGERHDYRLTVELVNTGTSIVSEWLAEVWFPSQFIENSSKAKELVHFEVDDSKYSDSGKRIWPGRRLLAFQIDYVVTGQTWPGWQEGERPMPAVRVRVSAEGQKPFEAEIPFMSIQNF